MGAALGPSVFRKAFARLSGRESLALRLLKEGDQGDAGPFGEEVEQNHRLSRDLVLKAHQRFPVSVVVGGGHDHAFPHLQGIQEAGVRGKKKPRVGCINIDAHLDVREPSPKITSGSGFYLAVESGVVRPGDLIELGIQSQCNGPILWDYADRKKIKIHPYDDRCGAAFEKALRELSRRVDAIVISLDLDAILGASAPGVSAPQADGFSPAEVFRMLLSAGKCPKVASLGIFELNPLHDVGDRTAILAATAAFRFLEGLTTRRARS